MNVVQQLNERKQKALQTHKMPYTAITAKWFNAAKIALEYSSCMSLGISPVELKRLMKVSKEGLTLMDFALLSNNLESKSAKDLGVGMDEYLDLLESGASAASEWQTIVGELDDKIKHDLAEEAKKAKEDGHDTSVGTFNLKPAQA